MRNGRSQPQGVQLVPQRSGGSGGAPTACLPLLPLHNAVLLPGGFARVAIPASWSRSRALIELLQQQAGEVLVAAVPYLQRGGSERGGRAAGGGGSSSGSEDEAGSEGAELDLDRLHHTGTAARVIQLTRRTQVRWALGGACAHAIFSTEHCPNCTPPPLSIPPSLATHPAVGRLGGGSGGAVPRARARRAAVVHLAAAAGAVRGDCRAAGLPAAWGQGRQRQWRRRQRWQGAGGAGSGAAQGEEQPLGCPV